MRRGGPARARTTGAVGEHWIFFAAAAFATAVALAYGPGQAPLLEDNQHYFFMAERFADGVPPHVSNFDPKNALSVVLTGLGIEAGRWAGISDVAASRVVSVGVFAAAVGLLALFAFRISGSATAAGITALVLGGLHYLPLMTASGSRPKVFLLLFIAASLFLLTRERWHAAAASASLGFLTWQPALLLVGSLLAAQWLARRDLRALAVTATVAAVPVVAYEAYFVLEGALTEQLTQAYLFPATYMTGQFGGLGEGLAALARYWEWGYSVDAFGVGLTWIVPALFAGSAIVCAVRLRTRLSGAGNPWGELRRRPALVHFALSMLGAFAFTCYDASGAPDFFFVFPYAAVVIGAAVAILARRVDRGPLPRGGSALAAGVGALLLLAAAAGAREARLLPSDIDDQRELGARVGDWLTQGESVYAVATTHLLAFNRAPNWAPYSYFFRGLPGFLGSRTGTDVHVPRRGGDLPDVVLTSRSWPPGWPGWLEEAGYREVADESFARQDIRVWRRSGARDAETTASSGRRELWTP